jgi:hypothetical protein
MSWHLRGDYFENCSCDILCPCITSSMQGPADTERCRVPLICHVEDGEKDGVRLDGLSFVLVVDSPAVMAEGGWRVAIYIDERADDAQREALQTILSGAAGGPPEALGALLGEVLGVKFVPMRYETRNGTRRFEVPGIMEVEVELVRNPATNEVISVTNTVHPMGADLPIARGLVGRYDDPDFGLAFDNTGKNGHAREFAWSA